MRTRFAERHATPRVAPGLKTGYVLVRANALHERNHGGEDHPVPCRTRQLSSPSPKVLRCSPWEDRPFRSCRAFPFSWGPRGPFPFLAGCSALYESFLGPEGPFLAFGGRAGPPSLRRGGSPGAQPRAGPAFPHRARAGAPVRCLGTRLNL